MKKQLKRSGLIKVKVIGCCCKTGIEELMSVKFHICKIITMKKIILLTAILFTYGIVSAQTTFIYKMDQYNHMEKVATVVQIDQNTSDVYYYDQYNHASKAYVYINNSRAGAQNIFNGEYENPFVITVNTDEEETPTEE